MSSVENKQERIKIKRYLGTYTFENHSFRKHTKHRVTLPTTSQIMEFSNNYETELKIDSSQTLWMYLDSAKFYSFITSKKLFFSRLDFFEDQLEGMTEQNLADWDTWGGMPDLENINPNLPEEFKLKNSKAKIENLDRVEKETLISQKGQFANCWFAPNTNSESRAMWDLYSNESGIAIKVNAKFIFETIKSKVEKMSSETNFHCVTFGFIEYRPISPFDFYFTNKKKHIFNAFKKDLAYEHEKEFRFVAVLKPEILDDTITGFQIPVDDIMESFEFISHPKQPTWVTKTMNENLIKWGINKSIKKSGIKI